MPPPSCNPDPGTPVVSVLLPVRNEERHLRECLSSLVGQDFPAKKMEVLAVDGRSEDATLDILEEFRRSYPGIRIIDNPKRSVTAALNIAVGLARGRYFVRCDAHARYAPDYLSSCLAVAEETGAANVGGHMRALPGQESAVARAIMLAHYSRFGLGGGRFHDPSAEGYVETVWLGCYRRDVFDRIGCFNERLPRSEDIDLNARLLRAGMRCYLSKRIRASYFCRSGLPSLLLQKLRDGIGVIRTLRYNRRAVRVRHCIPPIFVTSLLLFAALSWLPLFRGLLFLELALYAAAAGFFTILAWIATPRIITLRRRDRLTAALMLPVVFAAMHVAYGIGSLYSLITLPVFILKTRNDGAGPVP